MDTEASNNMEFEIQYNVEEDYTTEEILENAPETIENANSELKWEDEIDIEDLFCPSPASLPPPTFAAELLNTVDVDTEFNGIIQNRLRNFISKAQIILRRCSDSFPTRTSSKALEEHEFNPHAVEHVYDKRVEFREFSCVTCAGRNFIDQKSRDEHLKQYHINNVSVQLSRVHSPFECPYCTRPFLVSKDLSAHVESEHNDHLEEIKPPLLTTTPLVGTKIPRDDLPYHDHSFPCLKCKIRNNETSTSRLPVFPTQARLTQHVRLYHDPASSLQKCPHCDKNLRTKWHLKNHILAKHLNGPKLRLRNHVGENQNNLDTVKTQKSKRKLCDHIIQIHKTAKYKALPTDSKKQLGECDNESEIKTNAKNQCQPLPSPRLQCPRCLSTFSNKKHLRFHTLLKHVEKKEFPCLICTSRAQGSSSNFEADTKIKISKFIFKDEISLNQHMTNIHYSTHRQNTNLPESEKVRISVPKNKICPICSKKFDGKHAYSNYRSHMKTHLGVKRYSCEHCFKKFSSKLSLHAHLIRYHNYTSEQLNFKYACKICPFITMTQSLLNYHMGRKHPYSQKEGDQIMNVETEPEPNQSHGNSSKNRSSSTVCYVCSKIQTSRLNLIEHLKEHRGEGRFFCDLCPRDYSVRMSLLIHLRMDHHKLSYCNKCFTSFTDAAEFNQHNLHVAVPALNSKVNSPVNNLKCKICGKSSKNPCLLKIHTISHLRKIQQQELDFPADEVVSTRKIYKCSTCPSAFDRQSYLHAHLEIVHESPVYTSRFMCGKCERNYKFISELKYHDLVVHSSKINQHINQNSSVTSNGKFGFKCDVCLVKFSTQSELTDHQDKFRSEVLCHICAVKFKCNAFLEIHLKRVHNQTDNSSHKYLCHICPSTFFDGLGLKKHVEREHEGKFKRRSRYESAEKTIVNQSETFRDRISNKQVSATSLGMKPEKVQNQRKISHDHRRSKNKVKITTKSVVCHVCSKIQTTKGNLMLHLKEHRGERRAFCDLCPRDYHDRFYLMAHLKLDHHKLAYCSKCFTSFADKVALKQHALQVNVPTLNSNQTTEVSQVSENTDSSKSNYLKCKICDESSKSPCLFKIHTISHLKEIQQQEMNFPDDEVVSTRNIFKCSLCPSAFDRQSYLNAHLEIVHEISPNISCFHCGKCERKYKLQNELKSHDLVVHSVKINQHKNPNPNYSDTLVGAKWGFECSTCLTKFLTKSELTHHLDIFQSKLSCHICSTKFNCKSNLRAHMERVHRGKDFECGICLVKFSRDVDLQRHVRQVHERKKGKKSN